jgi:hypothetical protein
MDAMQHVRMVQRWEELVLKNQAIKKERSLKAKYKPFILSSRDTPRHLVESAKKALCKMSHQWSITQIHRI